MIYELIDWIFYEHIILTIKVILIAIIGGQGESDQGGSDQGGSGQGESGQGESNLGENN